VELKSCLRSSFFQHQEQHRQTCRNKTKQNDSSYLQSTSPVRVAAIYTSITTWPKQHRHLALWLIHTSRPSPLRQCAVTYCWCGRTICPSYTSTYDFQPCSDSVYNSLTYMQNRTLSSSDVRLYQNLPCPKIWSHLTFLFCWKLRHVEFRYRRGPYNGYIAATPRNHEVHNLSYRCMLHS